MSINLTPITPGANLVATDVALQNAQLAAIDSSLLASLLDAASSAIRTYCKRYFSAADFVYFADGTGNGVNQLILPEYPVNSIARLAADPQPVLSIANTGSTQNQRATVATTSTALVLVRVASGVTTTSTLLYSDYPLLSQMATAVGNLGNGWVATANVPYASYQCINLKATQGAFNALAAGSGSGATLQMFIEDIQAWPSGYGYGYDQIGYWPTIYGWQLDAGCGKLFGMFPAGQRNVELRYNAGYTDIPGAIQQACILWALSLYQQGTVNFAVKSESLGPQSYTIADPKQAIPPMCRVLLSPYVAHSNLMIN